MGLLSNGRIRRIDIGYRCRYVDLKKEGRNLGTRQPIRSLVPQGLTVTTPTAQEHNRLQSTCTRISTSPTRVTLGPSSHCPPALFLVSTLVWSPPTERLQAGELSAVLETEDCSAG